jgi:hypothetical protein
LDTRTVLNGPNRQEEPVMDVNADGLSLPARRVNLNAILLIPAILVALLVGPWVASIASAEQQQQVSVCERQWYCAWLCKKCHVETRWCYTFSSMKTSCRVVYESLHGCEQGKEYAWSAGCFGWYTACFTGTTQCFANRLTSTGGCSESICSAPIGMLGDPREELAEAAPGVTVGESCGARTDSCPGDNDCSTALPTGHAAEGVARAGASAAGM